MRPRSPVRLPAKGSWWLAAGSLAVTLALAEVALRVAEPWVPTNLVPAKYVRTVGTVRWPGYTGCYDLEGHSYYAINREGWRDRDHTIAKPPGTVRIAVIGDSYVEALQVDLGKTFWQVLERDLRARGKPVEVLAFGHAGFHVAQYFETLKHHAARYRPDVVIVGFVSGNDLHDSVRDPGEAPWQPRYRLDEAGRPVLDASFHRYVDAQSRFLPQAYRTLRNSSLVLAHIDAGWKRLALGVPRRAGLRRPPAGSLEDREWQIAWGLAGPHMAPPAPGSPFELAWRLNERLLLAMDDFARAQHAHLAVLGVSNPDRAYALGPRAGVDPLYPEKRLEAFAQANGLVYLPLAYRLIALHRQTGQWYHGGDEWGGFGHWNERGHEEAARAVEELLDARRWLP